MFLCFRLRRPSSRHVKAEKPFLADGKDQVFFLHICCFYDSFVVLYDCIVKFYTASLDQAAGLTL